MKSRVVERFLNWCARARVYLWTLGKWMILAGITGGVSGVVGALFHKCVDEVSLLREAQSWLLFCLPLAGVLIVLIYKVTATEGQGTNNVIDTVQTGKGLPIGLIPAIFCSSVLTHLCGGSAGREGAALQMGGTIGYHSGKLLRLDDRDLRTATMAGMAAFFAALFGTPLAATVFALAVISVDEIYHAAMVPCLTAALTAYGVSVAMGVEPAAFSIQVPGLTGGMVLRVVFLSALLALVSIVFCNVMHAAEHLMQHLKNPWIRIVIGGIGVIGLTLLVGTHDYNGAGMEVIAAAVERGQAHPAAFFLKLLFTALTLSAGYKGGEVVPSFFVGATFGCIVGPFLGIPAGFAAALGLIGVFCGAVNCPLASIILSIELFGDAGMLYFAVVCGISYMLSGYNGLYSSQRILHSKLKARYINVHTNGHHEGTVTETMERYQ